jgi:hypothetical protein
MHYAQNTKLLFLDPGYQGKEEEKPWSFLD